MKKRLLSLMVLFLSLAPSCVKDDDYVEQSVSRIYRLDGIELYTETEGLSEGSFGIQPKYVFDEILDQESRAFYSEHDTLLIYRGHMKIGNSNMYMKWWNLIDLRITSINVITKEWMDAEHPAGASINELLNISYWYKRQVHTKPIADIQYGNLMLGDFVPTEDAFMEYPGMTISCIDPKTPNPQSIEVHVQDAFGREFIATLGAADSL